MLRVYVLIYAYNAYSIIGRVSRNCVYEYCVILCPVSFYRQARVL